jgi:hypothetical protein
VTADGNTILSFDLGYEMSETEYGEVKVGEQTYKSVTVKPMVTIGDDLDHLEEEITTLNFDALSTWQKLKSPARFKASWLAMTNLIDKMLN